MIREMILRAPFGRVGAVSAGPFPELLKLMTGRRFSVCLAPETIAYDSCADARPDEVLPVPDFGVPRNAPRFVAVAERALVASLRGDRVLVGCAGGLGRTGMMLAVMARVAGCGAEDVVDFVRAAYDPEAIETRAQERWVETVDIGWARHRVWLRCAAGLAPRFVRPACAIGAPR